MSFINAIVDDKGFHSEKLSALASSSSLLVRVPSYFQKDTSLGGNDLNDVGLIDGINISSITGSAIPANVRIVAKSGGQYTSINEALTASSTGDAVIIYPGTWVESFEIPSGIRVVGYPAAQSVIITGSAPTGTRVLMNDPGTLREVTVVGPESGVAPAIDASGLGAGELSVLFNVSLRGGGASHTGPLVRGAGSGILAAIQGLYHNGGVTGGNFFECSGGVCIGLDWVANAGQSAAFARITGGILRIQNIQFQNSVLYTCTDGFSINAGELQAQSILIPDVDSPCTNALRITGDGVELDMTDCQLFGSTQDLLVDSSLTGAGSIVVLGACDFEHAKTSYPAAWDPDKFIASYTDRGASGDNPGTKFEGHVDVGSKQFPTSISSGEGDSTVLGQLAYAYDDSGSSFVDVTTQVTGAGGTPASWNLDTGDALLVGVETFKPTMFDLENSVALTGSLAVEVWTGAAWTAIEYMVATSDPGTSYAKSPFGRTSGDENIRLNVIGSTWSSWTAHDPASDGTDRFYLRFRNDGAITTSPTIDRIKSGGNFIEEKASGTNRFGTAESLRTFWEGTGQGLSAPSGGANSPGNADITISSNISYRQAFSDYATNQNNRAGTQIEVPENLDTSRPVTFILVWTTDGTDTSAVKWDLFVTEIQAGDVLNSTVNELAVITNSIAPSGTAQTVYKTTFSANIENLTPGDEIAFLLRRNGSGGGSDSNSNSAIALTMAWEGYFYD